MKQVLPLPDSTCYIDGYFTYSINLGVACTVNNSRDSSKVNQNKVQAYFSSVQFNRSVMSDSLRPYESQHARPSCPSPTPEVHSNSCPSSQ